MIDRCLRNVDNRREEGTLFLDTALLRRVKEREADDGRRLLFFPVCSCRQRLFQAFPSPGRLLLVRSISTNAQGRKDTHAK